MATQYYASVLPQKFAFRISGASRLQLIDSQLIDFPSVPNVPYLSDPLHRPTFASVETPRQ